MSDKHANKGNAIRKTGHAKEIEQAEKVKAAKKLTSESLGSSGIGNQEAGKRPKK